MQGDCISPLITPGCALRKSPSWIAVDGATVTSCRPGRVNLLKLAPGSHSLPSDPKGMLIMTDTHGQHSPTIPRRSRPSYRHFGRPGPSEEASAKSDSLVAKGLRRQGFSHINENISACLYNTPVLHPTIQHDVSYAAYRLVHSLQPTGTGRFGRVRHLAVQSTMCLRLRSIVVDIHVVLF